MGDTESSVENSNPSILGVEVWGAKGIQMVLTKISNNREMDFEGRIKAFRDILKYPGMWDELNITAFIGIFYKTVKRYHGDIDNNITMQSIWKKFEWVRSEQLMEGVTISTEDKVKMVLEGRGEYSHGKAQGLGGVGALSVGK